MKKKYEDADWLALENEFVTDASKRPCTLKELAERHNMSYSRLRHYAGAHEWSEKRHNHRANIAQKTAEKLAEALSKQAAEALSRHYQISSDLLTVIENALRNPDELITNDSRFMNMVNALDKLQKMQRQTLGLMDKKDEEQLAIAKQKVEPQEEEEYEDDGFFEALKGASARVWANHVNADEDDELA